MPVGHRLSANRAALLLSRVPGEQVGCRSATLVRQRIRSWSSCRHVEHMHIAGFGRLGAEAEPETAARQRGDRRPGSYQAGREAVSQRALHWCWEHARACAFRLARRAPWYAETHLVRISWVCAPGGKQGIAYGQIPTVYILATAGDTQASPAETPKGPTADCEASRHSTLQASRPLLTHTFAQRFDRPRYKGAQSYAGALPSAH